MLVKSGTNTKDAFVKGGASDSGERLPNKWCPLQFDPWWHFCGETQQSAESHCRMLLLADTEEVEEVSVTSVSLSLIGWRSARQL